jgi:hypothetical protein
MALPWFCHHSAFLGATGATFAAAKTLRDLERGAHCYSASYVRCDELAGLLSASVGADGHQGTVDDVLRIDCAHRARYHWAWDGSDYQCSDLVVVW